MAESGATINAGAPVAGAHGIAIAAPIAHLARLTARAGPKDQDGAEH